VSTTRISWLANLIKLSIVFVKTILLADLRSIFVGDKTQYQPKEHRLF